MLLLSGRGEARSSGRRATGVGFIVSQVSSSVPGPRQGNEQSCRTITQSGMLGRARI